MNIPKRWVLRTSKGSPSAVPTHSFGLLPDDFASHQEAKIEHLLRHDMMKRDIRLPSDPYNIDHSPATWFENSIYFSPDQSKHLLVLVERKFLLVFLEAKVGRRGHAQPNGVICKFGHGGRVPAEDLVDSVGIGWLRFSDLVFEDGVSELRVEG